jgi:hypothetical protein
MEPRMKNTVAYKNFMQEMLFILNVYDKPSQFKEIQARVRKLNILEAKEYLEYLEVLPELPNGQIVYNLFSGVTCALLLWIDELSCSDKILGKAYYDIDKCSVVLSKDDYVNGYQLIDIQENANLFTFEDFEILYTMWQESLLHDWIDDEFERMFHREACADWGKMGQDGSSFDNQFWNASKDSDEYLNAYIYTMHDNLQALLKLPYPRRVLLQTIKIGCKRRRESVRYSNMMCHYMEQKMKLIHQYYIVPTLQVLCLKALKLKCLPLRNW